MTKFSNFLKNKEQTFSQFFLISVFLIDIVLKTTFFLSIKVYFNFNTHHNIAEILVKKEEKGGKKRETKFVFLLFFGMILLLIQNECIHIISYLLTKKEKKWKEKGKKGICFLFFV
jgi:hypothetical protein